jgi:hypothetical protein
MLEKNCAKLEVLGGALKNWLNKIISILNLQDINNVIFLLHRTKNGRDQTYRECNSMKLLKILQDDLSI